MAWATRAMNGSMPMVEPRCGPATSLFGSLARQIRAGLNVAMSGIPWWNTDIGGFSGVTRTIPHTASC